MMARKTVRLDIIHELAAKDKRIRPVVFARNFGHQTAVTAGLDYCRGRAAVIIDAGLTGSARGDSRTDQEMARRLPGGLCGASRTRGRNLFKKMTASMFYRVIFRITDVKIPLDTGDFRLLDRSVINVMNSMRERHRFLRGMSSWVGFKQVGVPYNRAARFAGKTKYPFKKMLMLALNAITGFSYFPLQLATYIGFFCALVSIICIPVVAIMRASGSQAFFGEATVLIAVLFLGGVQLISLGILGEYIGRIYDEVKGRPLYVVRESPVDDQFDER